MTWKEFGEIIRGLQGHPKTGAVHIAGRNDNINTWDADALKDAFAHLERTQPRSEDDLNPLEKIGLRVLRIAAEQ
jgi:hypothetical protein